MPGSWVRIPPGVPPSKSGAPINVSGSLQEPHHSRVASADEARTSDRGEFTVLLNHLANVLGRLLIPIPGNGVRLVGLIGGKFREVFLYPAPS